MQRILVIKLSAFGDVILALGACRAVRDHHPAAHITLLTTAAYAGIGRDSGLFDAVMIDPRPRWTTPGRWFDLRRRLRAGRFDRVYDFQTNTRTGLYFRLFWPDRAPEWVGTARGCSHPLDPALRHSIHAFDRHAAQLKLVGIDHCPLPDVSFLTGEVPGLTGDQRPVLLVPGCAPHRPEKRWPAAYYADLANRLAARGLLPVLIGTKAEAAALDEIATACPAARNLGGQTSLGDIAALARIASGAVGNDTGPMHLIAAAGCPSLALFSAASTPEKSRPIGPRVAVLQREPLADLSVDDVQAALPFSV